jgi:hypothetical protein
VTCVMALVDVALVDDKTKPVTCTKLSLDACELQSSGANISAEWKLPTFTDSAQSLRDQQFVVVIITLLCLEAVVKQWY